MRNCECKIDRGYVDSTSIKYIALNIIIFKLNDYLLYINTYK